MALLVSMVAKATEPPTSAELSGVVRIKAGTEEFAPTTTLTSRHLPMVSHSFAHGISEVINS